MTDHLSCAIVRDLLPSYVEGLTEEETNQAVAAHLAHCSACSLQYRRMSASDGTEQTEEARQVDYLKTVRKKNRKKIIVSVLSVLLVVLLGILAKLYLIGSPAAGIYGRPVLHTETNTIELNLMNPSSGTAYTGWKTDYADGILSVTAREVLVSPLHRSGSKQLELPMEGVREVWVFDQLVWKDGLFIDNQTVSLYAAKTPYVGDAPAVVQLGSLLDSLQYFPPLPHTYELYTSSTPYRWTLVYQKSPGNWLPRLEQAAPLVFALVDNLDEIAWTWPGEAPHVLTVDEASAALPGLVEDYNAAHGTCWNPKSSIRDYGTSLSSLQQLMELLGLGATAAHTIP